MVARAMERGQRSKSTINDDGPGFAPDIMDRIGEPYVTSRRRSANDGDEEPTGLGLGFFIAKTLLERSGATLTFREPRVPGARRRDQAALAAQRFRAAINVRGSLRSHASIINRV